MPVIIERKFNLVRDWKFLNLNLYDFMVLLIIYFYIQTPHKKIFVNKKHYVSAFVKTKLFFELRKYKNGSMSFEDYKSSIRKLVKCGLLGVVGYKYLVQTQKGFDFVNKLIELNNILGENNKI